MDAKLELKCSQLQEYIQQFYFENYDYFETFPSKINGLKSHPFSSGWIYSGKLGYIVDNVGKVHYYLDCDKLPEEAKQIIENWEPKTYADYVNGNNVFGITEDLEVYYSSLNDNGDIQFYGKKDPVFLDENGDEQVFDSNSSFGKLLRWKHDKSRFKKSFRTNIN